MIPLPEFVHLLRREIEQRAAELSEQLIAGGAPDFPTYTGGCGKIDGLREVRQMIDNLVKKVNEGPI